MGKHVQNKKRKIKEQKKRLENRREQLLEKHENHLEQMNEKYEEKKEHINAQADQLKKHIEESGIKNVRKNTTYSFKRLFHSAFDLTTDQASYEEIEDRIRSGTVLRGTNMCILILAIFIASVGLNMNSTAVIIGAMLVSPLMGPIMGIGFSIASYDKNLFKHSATILFFEVVVALATSTIYFSLTPITTAGSELLARTSPAIWDVIIAVCGGLAGMIGTTREEKSNIIPGVAIATALMPPLCTAGYGLAMGNLRYFAGAMYLFCINGIFIAISTMLITVFLRLPSKNKANEETKKQTIQRVILVAVVAIVPSLFLAANMVSDSVFDSNVNNFMNQEFQFENTQVVKYNVDSETKELKVAVIGSTLDERTIASLKRAMKNYHIDSLDLKIHQTEVKSGITIDEMEKYVMSTTSQMTAENEEEYQALQGELLAVQTQLAEYESKELDIESLKAEIVTLYPEITGFTAGYMKNSKNSSDENQQGDNEQITIVLQVTQMMSKSDMERIHAWFLQRLNAKNIILYQNYQGVLYPVEYEKTQKQNDKKSDSKE